MYPSSEFPEAGSQVEHRGMSTSAISGQYPAFQQERSFTATQSPVRLVENVRRRPTQAQGRALEALGHAIEYLVDSRAFAGEDQDRAAVDILRKLNRVVFFSFAAVIPVRQQLKLALPVWLRRMLAA